MDQTLNVVNLEPAAPGLRSAPSIHLEREMCVAVEPCGWRGPFRRWMSLSRHAVASFVVNGRMTAIICDAHLCTALVVAGWCMAETQVQGHACMLTT